MKNLILMAALALASIAPTAETANAQSTGEACRGEACDDVSFVFSGGCYRITNNGSRRVRVHMGNISFGLERGQTHTLVNPFAQNACLQAFRGSVRAIYS